NFAITENKQFVLIFPRSTDDSIFQKALQSIWEQDYPYYRLVCLGEGEGDAVSFYSSPLGKMHALYSAIHACKDNEIIVLLDENSWLSHEGVLSKLNQIYQSPTTWAAFGAYASYPEFKVIKAAEKDYTRKKTPLENLPFKSFYAKVFKKIRLSDFIFQGSLLEDLSDASYVPSILEMAAKRTVHLTDVLSICKAHTNEIPLVRKSCLQKHFSSLVSYGSLIESQPKEEGNRADIIIFSQNHPMYLYALLESLQKRVDGFFQVTVFYKRTPDFEKGYEIIKEEFLGAQFLPIDDSFQNLLFYTIDEHDSDFVLFASDELILQDYLDLNQCMDEMKEAHAYGFYLSLNDQKIPTGIPLKGDIKAWSFEYAKQNPHNLEMTLFQREEIRRTLGSEHFEDPESMVQALNVHLPKNMLGLYYLSSKTSKIHAEISSVEMLQKIEEGFKPDVTSADLIFIPKKNL
ncbi:MAG TPA: hypothetical protein VLG44_04370, partial [Chlamydiales bacterium]|nr:hypothetical protein [Chlamydiales bacterium]